ncbi:helicase C-terminal domain-containing protein [Mesobacillus harenae]|uniref:helicase C-terminal domain-containing protein n=1 Tax=Mesobacillus harenae TaxID=2213203 RepID=UPI0015807390|nr:helicase C-terminal domain-containing protein [Mesobacillus harenae]
MKSEIKLPVRMLAEYVFRSGSIESGFRSTSSMIEGTKAHKKIQKTYKEGDETEVLLSKEIADGDLVFVLNGRCDGLLFTENEKIIDEIKSTSGDLALITEDNYPAHWAQAECYAYMYAADQNCSKMTIQLTYFQTITTEIKQFRKTKTFEELEANVLYMLAVYKPFATFKINHKSAMIESVKQLEFPFKAYRQGQRKLAGTVYKTILDGRKLYATAPTGIGKTISTLFPAVKAAGEGLTGKIFYLTAKTITRQTAEESVLLMKQNGLIMKSVTITAKDKICFQEETVCTKAQCPYANGYFDRINGAVLDILENEVVMDRAIIVSYAHKHQICPFEFSIDLAYLADIIICDYNYIFDPRVSLKRQLDEEKKRTVLLVDEAHNLVDRSREMFSATLEKAGFLELKREYKGGNPVVYQTAKDMNDYFIDLQKQGEGVFQEQKDDAVSLLESFVSAAETELISKNGQEDARLLLDNYFAAQSYLRTAKFYDERFVTIVETAGSQVKLRIYCLDPSYLLGRLAKEYQAAIFFSATLSPMDYHKDILGGEQEDYKVSIPSPYSHEQIEMVIFALSTRYRDRDQSVPDIVAAIGERVERETGNYLVFFPSYQYMKNVYASWKLSFPNISTIIQEASMTEAEREKFLAGFKLNNPNSLVGFAILGGIFSEGIDLKGDRLNGVLVVGVGLPQIGKDRDIIKDYFNKSGKNGYDYAYVFPGMNKVLQAGGRLIRSEEDHGSITLIDDRFLQAKYQRLFPEEWRSYKIIRPIKK